MELLIDGDLQRELKRLVHYDPETGVFTRLVTTSSRSVKGSRAGSKSGDYRKLRLGGKYYPEHHTAFLYMLGYLPKMVDHKNRDKLDNSWANLRECTPTQNQLNRKVDSKNTSGYSGVSWDRKRSRWRVRFRVEGKSKDFGSYGCLELAGLVATEAREKYHGEFVGEN